MRRAILAMGIVSALSVAAVAALAGVSARPASWAQPIEMAGVPNLHKVSDALYRSAQPTAEGMRNLRRLGIKTVVNLPAWLRHLDTEAVAREAGILAPR